MLDDGWFPAARRHRRARRLVGRPGGVARGPRPRWSSTCAGSACSSGSGSSPRWSTPTPTSTASTPTGSSRPATGCRCSQRDQLVLDLSRAEVREHVFEQISARARRRTRSTAVKWDHNRDLLEAGSGALGGAPGRAPADRSASTRCSTRCATRTPGGRLGVVRLGRRADRPRRAGAGAAGLDLRHDRRPRAPADPALDHPAGGAGVRRRARLLADLPHHGPDASAWTSAPPLRCSARSASSGTSPRPTEDDLDRLGRVGAALQAVPAAAALRPRGPARVVRPGRAAARRGRGRPSEALVAHVQLDEPAHNRGVWVRVPGLDPEASYDARWEGPVDHRAVSKSSPLPATGPTAGRPVTGRALATRGFWLPRRRPETVTLVHLVRAEPSPVA